MVRQRLSIRKLFWIVLVIVPCTIVSILFFTLTSMDPRNEDRIAPTPIPQIPQKKVESKKILTAKTHIFYYPWWGNPETDGKWVHWNHRILEGNAEIRLTPPEEIGANYYPLDGLYSSNDVKTVRRQMKEIREDCGLQLVSTSWYPPNMGDDEVLLAEMGGYTDHVVPLLLDEAARVGISLTFHIEPFKDRNAKTLEAAIKGLIDRYGEHSAMYRYRGRPVVWFYDSYQVDTRVWKSLFDRLRDTKYDVFAIGLLVEERHKLDIVNGGWDGFYTYFGTDGFTYGSTCANWADLVRWSKDSGILSCLCVAPGYLDTRIRPWNRENRRSRNNGQYYDEMFKKAIEADPDWIAITSYNEAHEGTQIEPAKTSEEVSKFTKLHYHDYEPLTPYGYLSATLRWVRTFESEVRKG